MGENPEIAAKTDKAVAIDTTSEEASSAEVKEQKAKRTILLYDCGSNLETDAGIASIIITGKGRYIDSVILTFKINKTVDTNSIEPEVIYSGNVINYPKIKPSVNTGVETNTVLWFMMMAGATVSSFISGFVLRRKD